MWTDQQHAACVRFGTWMAMVEVQGREGGGGEYEAHSERRFIKPAGTLFASERLFLFVVGGGCWNLACFHLSVSHLLEE